MHGARHGVLVLAVAGADVKNWDSPGVGFVRVKLHVIVITRQTLALRVDAEVIRYLTTYLVAQRAAKAAQAEGVSVEFLPAVTGQIVAAEEILVCESRIGIDVFRNDITSGTPDRLAARRPAEPAVDRRPVPG